MKIDYKNLTFDILIALFIGSIPSLFIDMKSYQTLLKPSFSPPGIVFPIVWTVLFILMGVSFYQTRNYNNNKFKIIYFAQLFVNSLWSIFFFLFEFRLFSFFWIIFLIILVSIMIFELYKLVKEKAFLQIPYLLWLIFASILNLSIYFLNK